jgi:membrane protein implicated in regulation of membrane protease activity
MFALASQAAFLVYYAMLVAVPAFLLLVLWRFLRAYEQRSMERMDITQLGDRIRRLEERIADLQGEMQVRSREHAASPRPLLPGGSDAVR